MPIYAFQCDPCGHEFDRLQRLSDPDPENCPVCKAKGIRRKLNAPSFRLAGTGWYETDFKKDGEKKRNLADSGTASAEAGSSTTPAAGEASPGVSKASAPDPTPTAS